VHDAVDAHLGAPADTSAVEDGAPVAMKTSASIEQPVR